MNKEIQTTPYRINKKNKPKAEDYGYEQEPINAWMLVGGEAEYKDDLKEWELQESHDACGGGD
jgi:hypothetical protein